MYQPYNRWNLVYSSERDGFGLKALYERCKQNPGPTLMAIRSECGNIFGAYASDTWGIRRRPFGLLECFLWKVSDSEDKSNEMKISIYTAKQNGCLMMATPEYISMGGSSDVFGLTLNKKLWLGSSHPVETFKNDYLAMKCYIAKPMGSHEGAYKRGEFICMAIELWGF